MVWGGAGAVSLGLEGEVGVEEWRSVFGTGGARHQESGERLVHCLRPGMELVVSPHKSVAELGVIGQAEDMHLILDAERDATMAYLDEVVTQYEHTGLARRQDLKGGHEGQGDGLGLLVTGLGAERHVGGTRKEGVGVGLEPQDFAQPGRLGRFNLGRDPLLDRASAGRTTGVEAPVSSDLVEPRAE